MIAFTACSGGGEWDTQLISGFVLYINRHGGVKPEYLDKSPGDVMVPVGPQDHGSEW